LIFNEFTIKKLKIYGDTGSLKDLFIMNMDNVFFMKGKNFRIIFTTGLDSFSFPEDNLIILWNIKLFFYYFEKSSSGCNNRYINNSRSIIRSSHCNLDSSWFLCNCWVIYFAKYIILIFDIIENGMTSSSIHRWFIINNYLFNY
jgi:hypothetical protein